MSMIGGPGGVSGPKGPARPERPSELDDVADAAAIESARATTTAELDALAAEIAAGRLTPREVVDRLVEATAGPELGATERAELRELLGDLVANDPHLTNLLDRI